MASKFSLEANKEHEEFYKTVLEILGKEKLSVMLGGTYAVTYYTGIKRPTHDLDLYCTAGDFQKILTIAKKNGFKTEVTDARWLGKVGKGKYWIDFIFNTANDLCRVDTSWLDNAPTTTFLGYKVKVLPAEELIWIKSFMEDRRRSENPDVNHLILKTGAKLDWKRLLAHMEPHWEMLFANLIIFRFVYPSERELVPKWLLNELFERFERELNMPVSKEKVCRGILLSRVDYAVDYQKWGFKTVLEA